MIICLDFETNGLPRWREPYDTPGQPHVIQIGAVITDREFNEKASMRVLIQPAGWVIGQEAQEVNGISLDDCLSHGIPIKAGLVMLLEMAKQCRVAVAYNAGFENWFVRAELKRLGSDDPGLDRPGLRHVDPHKISGTLADDGKWMKLRALHELLLGWDYPSAHDALQDCRATLRCLRVMVERKLVEL